VTGNGCDLEFVTIARCTIRLRHVDAADGGLFKTRNPQMCYFRTGSTESRDGGCDTRRSEGISRQHHPDRFCRADNRAGSNQIAGDAGVVQYVSGSRPGANFEAKPLTREYADALRAAGLQIVSNYRYGKPGWPTPSDFTRGFGGGVADAQTALRLHAAAGGGDSAPIFFSIDEDIDLNTWNSVAVEWFRGSDSVLGVDRTGIYGHSRACAWAIQNDVIGRSTTAGHRWAWQTSAWSHGEREPMAVLYQVVVNSPSTPGPLLGGIHMDVDEVLATDSEPDTIAPK
jgi:hypothetical protein